MAKARGFNTKLTIVIAVIFTMYIVTLVTIPLQETTRSYGRSREQVDVFLAQLGSPVDGGPGGPITTVPPDVVEKLEDMKQELNDSRFTNDSLYPSRKIGRYLMLDPNLCRGVDKLDFIIIVHTAPGHLERRQRIRDSFARESLFAPTFRLRVAFLLGRTLNQTLERMLWLEHMAHNDTVMGSFVDDYHNLSIKGVMGFKWVSEHCANSEFVLKIDDDVMINMYKVLGVVHGQIRGKAKSIFCNLKPKDSTDIFRKGKWKVDAHIFSKRTTFPYDYCSGFMVIMSTDLMAPMSAVSRITPFFWIDDLYLFGMLPRMVGGVTYHSYPMHVNVTLYERVAVNCTKTLGADCPIFASIVGDQSFWSYWEMIKQLYETSNLWRSERKPETLRL
ncbi:unnamed protein product [Lymnaea stagnalis]|uniref:Hexosyltransferase n=1 Tax=Lymnaea stagnalis TaxID=6523 RepID=A0AAV2I6D3_LYMST